MSALTAYIDGIAVLGPGLDGWPEAKAVLAGRAPYAAGATLLPAPLSLPAAERRRTGRVVKLAIAVGLEAAGRAGLEVGGLVTVFSSSACDGDNCHEICQTLATAERQLSPTRFHNSVHNAAAGYWSIATGAMAASTALCGYDASFAAGLLEALSQVVALQRPVLLIAADTAYPPPLSAKRPLLDAFGIALALSPSRGERSVARLAATLVDGAADRLEDAALEPLRQGAPAGRGLPLLALLARRQGGSVKIEYLHPLALCAEVDLC